MSAFLLSNNHINSLVSFAEHRSKSLHTGNGKFYDLVKDFKLVAQILRTANEESIKYRYPQAKSEINADPFLASKVYTGDLREEDLIQAVNCYHYQSREHPSYQCSDAYFIAEAIKNIAVNALIDGKSNVWAL